MQICPGGAPSQSMAASALLRQSFLRTLGSAELRARARETLRDTGLVAFHRIFTDAALATASREAVALSPHAYITDAMHNAYQLPANEGLSSTHVRNLMMRTRVASNAFDEISHASPLKQLYMWDGFANFVAEVVGRPCYRLADPLGCCSINVFRPGWEHAWHFDESETTVTLCLQDAQEGGDFEYSSPIRTSTEDLAAPAVAAILRSRSQYSPSISATGAMDHFQDMLHATSSTPPSGAIGSTVPRVHKASFTPGSLQIFHGKYSLHRVTRVLGNRDRLVAVLCFASEPGVRNSPEVQQMFWGRTAQGVKAHVVSRCYSWHSHRQWRGCLTFSFKTRM
eukprot:6202083-Pleurochrysis_carterae.AAC.1